MKTITSISFLAALAAALFAPISLEVAGSLLLSTGLIAIIAADYFRRVRLPKYGRAPVLTFTSAPHGAAATPAPFELAA